MDILRRLFGSKAQVGDSFSLPGGVDARIGLIVSPDSRRLAYAVRVGGGMRVEVNGQPCRRFDGVSGVTLSKDALAYVPVVGIGSSWSSMTRSTTLGMTLERAVLR